MGYTGGIRFFFLEQLIQDLFHQFKMYHTVDRSRTEMALPKLREEAMFVFKVQSECQWKATSILLFVFISSNTIYFPFKTGIFFPLYLYLH